MYILSMLGLGTLSGWGLLPLPPSFDNFGAVVDSDTLLAKANVNVSRGSARSGSLALALGMPLRGLLWPLPNAATAGWRSPT